MEDFEEARKFNDCYEALKGSKIMEKKDHWEVTNHYDTKVIITACMISNVRSI